ncbi:MAG: ankyrin repeat domain-containing protein [Sedimentisphaerales bacterium]
MKRVIISIFVLYLLASSNIVPSFAGIDQISDLLSVQKELISTENEETATPKTNYVTELNKIGIAGRPESDNAAPYYEKAVELFVEKPEGLTVKASSWPKELPAQEQVLLRKWVQNNKRALEQLQLGSQKQYCWFKYTGETIQNTEMPQLSTRRQLALALQARAMLSAEDGNITNAADDIGTLYKYGAHIADGPKPLVEKLVGIAVKSLSIRAAFSFLDKKMVDANLIKSLEDEFKQLVADYSEPFDIRGEKIFMQEQVETNPAYSPHKRYLKGTLEYYDAMVAKTPWQLHNEQAQSVTSQNPLIEVLGSPMAKVIEIECRIRVEEQALITTLALLRYNAGSDGYPVTLQQLVSSSHIKELPMDPFSDKPLVYKQTRQGFTLYSFGADFDDDGGLHSKWGLDEEGGDQVLWPVERTQVAEEQRGRERSFARTESPQRSAGTGARSVTRPYPMDDEEETVPARSRPGESGRIAGPSQPLHDAARDGDIDQVQLLISQGADVNEKNRMGWTPLHTAIRNRQQALIEPLIAKGADVNAKDNSGQTPLLAAVYVGQKDTVELLIAKGADVNVMGGRGDNALSLAKKRGNTEIIDLLLKHGAKEPSLQDLMGDRYYGEGGGANLYPGYEEQATVRRGTRAISTIAQSPVQVDILADPNEIRARIKTFEGLDKALVEIDANSQSEMRQWQQKRYDNRTLLIRTVQKQFEDEIGFMQKVAVEEKAKKTTETIDSVLSGRQERFKEVSKELLAQRRELRQTEESVRTRGRTRTSGRSTRGRTSQRGQPYGEDMADPLYGRGDVMPRTTRSQSARGPVEQLDRETENEMRQWLQASVDDKENLAQAVHEQIRVEFSSVRNVAVEEGAKKTTAAIDGMLLYRQMRFDALIKDMEEGKQALLQQTQEPRIRSRGRYPQDSTVQQENQPRIRGRRR